MTPFNVYEYNLTVLKEIKSLDEIFTFNINNFYDLDLKYNLIKRFIEKEVEVLSKISDLYDEFYNSVDYYKKFSGSFSLGEIINNYDLIIKSDNNNSFLFYNKYNPNKVFIFDEINNKIKILFYSEVDSVFSYAYCEEDTYHNKKVSHSFCSDDQKITFNTCVYNEDDPDWKGINLSFVSRKDIYFIYLQDDLNETFENNFLQINNNYYRSDNYNNLLEDLDLFCDKHYPFINSTIHNWKYNSLGKNVSFSIKPSSELSIPLNLFFDIKLKNNSIDLYAHNNFNYNKSRKDFSFYINFLKNKEHLDVKISLNNNQINYSFKTLNKDSIKDFMTFLEINEIKKIPSFLYPLLLNIEILINSSSLLYNNVSNNILKDNFMDIIYNKSIENIKIINEKLISLLYNNDSIVYIEKNKFRKK